MKLFPSFMLLFNPWRDRPLRRPSASDPAKEIQHQKWHKQYLLRAEELQRCAWAGFRAMGPINDWLSDPDACKRYDEVVRPLLKLTRVLVMTVHKASSSLAYRKVWLGLFDHARATVEKECNKTFDWDNHDRSGQQNVELTA